MTQFVVTNYNTPGYANRAKATDYVNTLRQLTTHRPTWSRSDLISHLDQVVRMCGARTNDPRAYATRMFYSMRRRKIIAEVV